MVGKNKIPNRNVPFDNRTSAKEVNRDGLGVIRFYHDGGASGGGIDITREGSNTVKIAVDWLVGRVEVDFGRRDG